MINPATGKAALRLRVWFESRGESPQRPYTVRRRYEDRYVSVPYELAEEDERMSICGEAGETPEPWSSEGEPRPDGEGAGKKTNRKHL
jgi:hypothetical protein